MSMGTCFKRLRPRSVVFFNGLECRNDLVDAYDNVLLHRPGELSGLIGWSSSGMDGASVGVAFESSPEFCTIG